jgi:hypothetical protein
MTRWELRYDDGVYHIFKDGAYYSYAAGYHEALNDLYYLAGHDPILLHTIEVPHAT